MESSQSREATLKALGQLLLEDQNLQRQVQTLGDFELVVECLVQAGAAKGLALEAGEVHAALAPAQSLPTFGVLSDDMLDRVAGGMNRHEWNAMSLFSLGAACFAISAIKTQEEEAMNGDDRLDFSYDFCGGS